MSVDFAQDIDGIYADFGEACTVAGVAVTAIFTGGYTEALGVAGTTPALRCRASDVAAVANGAAVVRAGVNYILREKQPIAPDELETLLILERA